MRRDGQVWIPFERDFFVRERMTSRKILNDVAYFHKYHNAAIMGFAFLRISTHVYFSDSILGL